MARILVVGSVARDEVIRLRQPLRAGTHVEGAWHTARLGGGAASTSAALAHAGHHVWVVAAIGSDELGRELLEELSLTGVDTSLIRQIPGQSTRSLVMVDEGGERTVVNLFRAKESQAPSRLLTAPAECVYVRSRALDLAPLLADKAGTCRVVAQMPPCEPACRPAHVLVASEHDLDPADRLRPWELGRRVAGERLEWVVLTRGADGVEAHSPNQTLRLPAPRVKAVDTTGSGDAFAAGLIHSLVQGVPMLQALETGAGWGAESARTDSSVLPPEAIARLLGSAS